MRHAQSQPRSNRHRRGFTIVELLIVIVVIGILAAITIVAYNGIQQRAKIAAIQSDLEQGAKQLEVYRFGTSTSEQYPADQATASLKASSGTTLNYQVNNGTAPPSYCLTAVNGTLNYWVSNTNTTPTVGTCTGVLSSGISCPTGFIVVPGNSTFSTSEFCVMKYEAKQASATVPTSQATGAPWGNINQTNALAYSPNVPGCTGCHLITELEWQTIAANIASVASNWTSGTVGTGSLYIGHSDNVPANSLAASVDSDGYSGTGNAATSNQRRTLTLTNGEVIWDFSGDLWEWTSGVIAGNQQPGLTGENSYVAKEWNNGSLIFNGLPATSRPATGTPAAGAWTSANGVGKLWTNYGETASRSYRHGGDWNTSSTGVAGVWSLILADDAVGTNAGIGFRVSR